MTELASFGDGTFTTGSTIGPDGALYVTDGSAGSVLRVDRRTGRITDLRRRDCRRRRSPPTSVDRWTSRSSAARRTCSSRWSAARSSVLEVGRSATPTRRTASIASERGGAFTLVADIGQWSVDHPPVPAIFIDTGVHYAMESYRGGFLVTDGHHNRVLWVSGRGSIREVATFGNVVPTGLEVTKGRVFITQLGPIPHEPEDGKVLALRRSGATEIASGASMLIDVERGPNGRLYALSQGQWNWSGRGLAGEREHRSVADRPTRREPGPGRRQTRRELVLDRPTSMEIVGDTAYVVSVDGVIYKITNL